mmetsp:Transcript_42816/g.43365  ORF Transcript_42816/g.43365 Transcript_42816/m.43365 type:complete len:166 (-) Transcript_42816:18-515(-)
MERLYISYLIKNEKFAIASCLFDDQNQCDYSDTDFNFAGVDTDVSIVNANKVYDSVQLVSMPAVCCLCNGDTYVTFNQTTIDQKIKTLGSYLGALQVDFRTGVAYSVDYGNDGKLILRSEKILTDDDIVIQTDIQLELTSSADRASFLMKHTLLFLALSYFGTLL